MLGPRLAWDWHDGGIPPSAQIDDGSFIETSYSFVLDRSRPPYGVRVGRGSSTYGGTMFDLGERGRVTVGRYCMTNGARFVCDGEITVGDYSLLGWNSVIMDTRRAPLDPDRRRAALEEPAPAFPRRWVSEVEPEPVRIGRAVWVGFDCVIMPGVTVGDGAVVGARSVVAEDVEPWTVVAGNPARPVRRLTPPAALPDPPDWPPDPDPRPPW